MSLTVARPRSSKPSLTISTRSRRCLHQGLGFVQRGAFLHRDQAILRGHDVAQLVEVLRSAVAVGDDADQLAAFDHRQAGDAVLALQRDGVAHLHQR